MLSGFQTGKNKKIELKDNEKYNKLICLFEDMNEDAEPPKTESKPTITTDTASSISKEIIPSNSLLYHPSKFAEQNFQILSRPSNALSEKKISYQTVQVGNENDLQTSIKKRNEEILQAPLFAFNEILLSKISKLAKCLIGENMYNQSKQFMKNCQLKVCCFKRTSNKLKNYNWKFIKCYFKNAKIEKDWLKLQTKLVAWKLNSKDKFTDERLILELEYRHYIQYTLQSRTVIQEIWTKDYGLNCHLVLLVVAIENTNNKRILELSDGWYSIFFICEQNYESIYKKIKVGHKLHVTNLIEYPLIFDTSKIRIISKYPFNKLIVTTKINSIKLAAAQTKLGKQPTCFFLRSLKSLRSGIIPCLDVFVSSKSYLIQLDNNIKRAVIYQQSSQQEEKVNQSFQFLISVIDSLNYFDGQQKVIHEYKEILIHIDDSQYYEQVNVGQRIRIINAIQQQNEIILRQSKNSGMLFDLTQYSQYFSKLNLNFEKYNIILTIQQHNKTQTRDIFTGLSEQFGIIKIEVHSQFFQNILQQGNFSAIQMTQLCKIEAGRFTTTFQSKLIKLNNYQ